MPYKNPHYHRDYFRALGEKRRTYLRERYHKNPEKQRAASDRYNRTPSGLAKRKALNSSPQYIAKRKAWRDRNPERMAVYRRRRILKQYGVTEAWWQMRIHEQNHCCGLCAKSFVGMPVQAINIDHDHVTGHVRGILCNKCNTGLGAFNEDPAIFAAALAYLAAHAPPALAP